MRAQYLNKWDFPDFPKMREAAWYGGMIDKLKEEQSKRMEELIAKQHENLNASADVPKLREWSETQPEVKHDEHDHHHDHGHDDEDVKWDSPETAHEKCTEAFCTLQDLVKKIRIGLRKLVFEGDDAHEQKIDNTSVDDPVLLCECVEILVRVCACLLLYDRGDVIVDCFG